MKFSLLAILLIFTQLVVGQYGSKQKVFAAFVHLDEEIEASILNTKRNNDRLHFLVIKSDTGDSEDNALAFSDSLRAQTNSLINYINSMKALLIVKAEKLKKAEIIDHDTVISLKYINSLDDYSTPTMILIGDRWAPLEGQYSAYELKHKLLEYQEKLIELLEEEDKNTEIGISVIEIEEKEGNFSNWETDNFYNMPLGGVITYLSKIQLDIRLSESAILSYWLQK